MIKLANKEIPIELGITLALYDNVKSRSGRRYGFGVCNIHIHAYRFSTSNDNRRITLYGKDGYEITRVFAIDVHNITICGINSENILTVLYSKGASE